MSSIDRNAQILADMIRKLAGLPVPAPVTLKTQLPVQPASFPVVSKADIDKALDKDDKPPPVTSTGKPGYSERGAPEDWDTAMGEVYGYRWWYLPLPSEVVGYIGMRSPGMGARRQGTLYGANNQPWTDGRQVAVCTSRGLSYSSVISRCPLVHEPPETREPCGCGFWAYFKRGLEVRNVLTHEFSGVIPPVFSYGTAIPVFGVMKGTGRVIIGENGFRSQYAEAVGLCVPPVAVEQLSWWIRADLPSDLYYHSPYRDGNSFYNTLSKEKCTEEERVTRISEIEGLLGAVYPSARIFSSQELLTRYFPPDKNYA